MGESGPQANSKNMPLIIYELHYRGNGTGGATALPIFLEIDKIPAFSTPIFLDERKIPEYLKSKADRLAITI